VIAAAADRPSPRPAAGAVGPAVRTAGEVDQGRLGRTAVRHLAQRPGATKRGALAAVFATIAALTLTLTIGPASGVDAAAKPPAVKHTRSATPAPARPDAALADEAGPAAQAAMARKPTRAPKNAPASHGVISGLAANGIPSVALNAYRVAAARMADVDPSCGIPWYLLAGIGREESDHGRFGGAVLHADGVSTPKIIGPALDGTTWDYIPAPANGKALDGDAVYAHALGPMQFIPSTWAGYGADANGDGKADIFNINDAALGAARYLCAAGGDLRTTAGRTRAVLAYNHNDQYLAQVLALAQAYHRGVPISGLPVGITKGALPTVVDTGYIPPVNPGPPTAVSGHTPAKAHKRGKPSAGKDKSKDGGGAGTASGSAGSSVGSGSGSDAGAGSGSSAVPGAGPSSGSSPTSGGSSAPTTGAGAPSGGSSSTPSPTGTPKPTKTCNPLQKLLKLCPRS